jgi:hypothetical protein
MYATLEAFQGRYQIKKWFSDSALKKTIYIIKKNNNKKIKLNFIRVQIFLIYDLNIF